MSNHEENTQSIDRFRGWVVTMLYLALGLFSLVLAAGLLKVWNHIDASFAAKATLFALFGASAGFCFRSGFRFYKVMRLNVGIPRLHVLPFLFIVLALLAARLIFPA